MKAKKLRRTLAIAMSSAMMMSLCATPVLAEDIPVVTDDAGNSDHAGNPENADNADNPETADDVENAVAPKTTDDAENADVPETTDDAENASGGQDTADGQDADSSKTGDSEENPDDGIAPTSEDAADGALKTYEGQLGSFGSGGKDESDNDYLFTAGLFVNGDDTEEYSNPDLIKGGTYDKDSADGIVIDDSESGHNGIIIKDAGDYKISNAKITMNTDADGSDTCDFSGKGSAVAVYGDSNVVIEDSDIETTGVATMPIFSDTGSTVTVKSSTLKSNGGTLYGDYMNSPDQAKMVAPPWILGIMGTSRTTNLMGDNSTMNVIDSDTSAGAWAVLSTDSGSNMYLNIYNTSLTLNNADESSAAPLQQSVNSKGGKSQIHESVDNPYTTNYGSGYGTYVIGNAKEVFAGAEVNVGTYGSIFTGGSATYTNLEKGQSYKLESATGETDTTYTAQESKNTVINSDTFGFMVHQSANYITIEEGTVVNSGYATFLVKSGSSKESVEASIDDSKLNNGGVLIQVMDNDDATTGGMMDANDPANLNGGGMNFKTSHVENEGFMTGLKESSDDDQNAGGMPGGDMPGGMPGGDMPGGDMPGGMPGGDMPGGMPGEGGSGESADSEQQFTFTNGNYSGNIYNASGSDQSIAGSLEATALDVTVGEGAKLTGAAASTSAIHVTYDGSELVKANGGDAYETEEDAAEILEYQNTKFDMTHYFDIGQVANLINYNGGNDINMILTDDGVWNVDDTSLISTLDVSDNARVIVPDDVTLTISSGKNAGTYSDCVITSKAVFYNSGEKYYCGQLGSFGNGGNSDEDNDYLYFAALFVDSDDYETYSNTDMIKGGTYDAEKASNIIINDSVSGHNGVILKDVGEYTISNATIKMITDADGTDTCDFTGKGSAVAVYGNSVVNIENSHIETEGVATMPIFTDDGATATIKNSTLISRGGTLNGDYMNSPDQSKMVAPPWILGIMGSSRTTNLEGNDSTMNVIDSETYAGAWAVLSTDAGSNMYLNMYNTTLELLNKDESAAAPLQESTNSKGGSSQIFESVDNPYTENYGSGYGTYVIGNAVEVFAGATVNVGTYATIFTGGTATYTDIVKGQNYTLKNAANEENDVEYTASESKATTINSDTFGFMVHQSANYITIEKGTVVNSGYATFLVKSGSSNETVDADIDNSTLNNGGVLIQVMDNDDATTGGMMSADDPENLNGGNMNFKTSHVEAEGFNTAANENDGTAQNFTFTNGAYSGNIYNASGSDGSPYSNLKASTLNVSLGKGATLKGAAASTAAIHVTYDGSVQVKNNGGFAYDTVEDAAEILAYQNTEFDMTHYFDIGQVANLINYNGGNDVNMTLTDDAVWTVDGTSVISALNVTGDAKVVIPEGITLTVGDTVYSAGTITASGYTAAVTDDGNEDPGTDDGKTPGSDDGKTPGANTGTNSGTDNGTKPGTTSTSRVKTGDNAMAGMWVVLAAIAMGSAAVAVKRKRTF